AARLCPYAGNRGKSAFAGPSRTPDPDAPFIGRDGRWRMVGEDGRMIAGDEQEIFYEYARIHGQLGVYLNLTSKGWAFTKVMPGLTGERAGLKEGDLILAIDGLPVAPSLPGPAEKLRRTERATTLTIARSGSTIEVSIPAKGVAHQRDKGGQDSIPESEHG